jgi:hypothetical protein
MTEADTIKFDNLDNLLNQIEQDWRSQILTYEEQAAAHAAALADAGWTWEDFCRLAVERIQYMIDKKKGA